MSSTVARPIRSSSNTLTSSNSSYFRWRWCCIRLFDLRWPPGRRGSNNLAGSGSDFLHARRLEAAGQVDAELLGGAVHVVVGVAHLHRDAVRREHLDVQAQRLQLLQQHLERLGDAGLGDVLALDDRLVHLDPSEDG